MEQSLVDGEDSGIYQNLNETCKVRDVNDILGPLPQIPQGFNLDSDRDLSRRVSGIYEEIQDPSNRFVQELAPKTLSFLSPTPFLEPETAEPQRFMKK